jgi:hypothetical protein
MHMVERHDDHVAPGFDVDSGAIGADAGALGESREVAESGFEGQRDARLVHYTAHNPMKDIMAQRGLCSEGRASRGRR